MNKKTEFNQTLNHNKSQVNTIFLISLAVIIVILILFFSFRSISFLKVKSSEIVDISFIQTLNSDISRIKTQPGKIESIDYNVPAGIDYACFIDWNKGSFPPVSVDRKEIVAFLGREEQIEQNQRSNFLLVGKNSYMFKRFEDFSLDSKIICKAVEGMRFTAAIEGIGDKVRIG